MTTPKEYQPLTIPKLAWNKDTLNATFGELIAQPLEPGFGFTLGGGLRRVLLGAVEGSAVTSVIIKGVNNEFSTLPGIVEDAMQVALNCKGVVVKNTTGEPGTMRLNVDGQAVARVSDIVADDHLELVNKDHVIAHVSEGGKLDITFFVESGRGYQAAQWPVGKALQEDGRIYLDAMFTPVRRVTYSVEKTRVGRDIDYDKLTLIVMTDGTQSPEDVLHYAVSVLRTQYEHFLSVPEIPFNDISKPLPDESKEAAMSEAESKLQGLPLDLLLKPIDVLEFSVRAHNCLLNAGIKRIIDLVNLSEDEVLKIKNFGRKSYDEVRDSMKSFGLTFGMDISEDDVKNFLATEEASNDTSER